MGRLFNRGVAVTLAKPTRGSFQLTEPNAVRVTDLRVTFNVEKNLGKDPNTCEIVIFNLAKTTRAEVQKKPIHVTIDAGHDGVLKRLFTGDLRWAQSVHQQTEWETRIELADGDRAYRYARVARSYRPGVDALTAVNEVARSMGLKAAPSARALRELRRQYTAGLTLEGASREELSRVLSPFGLSWSIQDGKLVMYLEGEYRPDLPIVISADSGMVGVPENAAPEKPGKAPVLTVRTLLKPEVTPGGRVQLETRSINGVFRVKRVTHSGDTSGSDWYSTIEGVPA